MEASGFHAEIVRRAEGLMTSFRALHRAVGAKSPALEAHFRELFALQTWLSEHRPEAASIGSRDRQYELLYKSSLILDASLDSAQLLDLALDTLIEMCGCGRGFIAGVDEDGGFNFVTARAMDGNNIPEEERQISQSVLDRVRRTQQEVSLSPLHGENSLLEQTSLMGRTRGALVCVPVFIDAVVHAVIYLDRFDGELTLETFSLVKRFSQQLAAFLQQAEAFRDLRQSREQLLTSLRDRFSFEAILGRSPAMLAVLKTVAKLAPTDARALIQGETGTGKELIARALHANSARSEGPFVAVDCGALPENLLESTLFGHVRGAFTGAENDRVGVLEEATGGTLFLDEINNLPLEAQVKLLRVLQENRARRLGESRDRVVDFRLIAATSTDPEAMVTRGSLRQDLYYRINTVAIQLPPLRERREDIGLLANHFLARYCNRHDREPIHLAPAALTALEHHDFPGNVRELEHIIERAVILTEGDRISLTDLPYAFHGKDPWSSDEGEMTLEAYTKHARRAFVTHVLRLTGGNKTEAAKRLGINRAYLYELMAQLGLQ